MVNVIFLNLLRSKYRINQISVTPGTLQHAFAQIYALHPEIVAKDLEQAVIFINQVRIVHPDRLREELHPGDEVILTHFVGGG